MGEKIRDIRPIKIGNSSLMIELNEGYTATQGRVIHIQNSKFRYLLTEKDFLHFSSMVIRSWCEFEHIKKHWSEKIEKKDFPKRNKILADTKSMMKKISKLFLDSNFEYRILDIQDKLITMVVKEKEVTCVVKKLQKEGFKECNHPYGKKVGYHFLYQMHKFLLFKFENVYVEVYCQIPCASITPKTWIPLDRTIQRQLWNEKMTIDGVCWADIECQFIYHLCWAIFVNNGFSPFEKEFIKSHKSILCNKGLFNMLSLVFFNFTSFLVDLLKNEQFDDIVSSYYQFVKY